MQTPIQKGGGKEFLHKLLLGHLSGIELECQGPGSSQEVIRSSPLLLGKSTDVKIKPSFKRTLGKQTFYLCTNVSLARWARGPCGIKEIFIKNAI